METGPQFTDSFNPKYWRSPGSNRRPLDQKASDSTTAPRRLLLSNIDTYRPMIPVQMRSHICGIPTIRHGGLTEFAGYF